MYTYICDITKKKGKCFTGWLRWLNILNCFSTCGYSTVKFLGFETDTYCMQLVVVIRSVNAITVHIYIQWGSVQGLRYIECFNACYRRRHWSSHCWLSFLFLWRCFMMYSIELLSYFGKHYSVLMEVVDKNNKKKEKKRAIQFGLVAQFSYSMMS